MKRWIGWLAVLGVGGALIYASIRFARRPPTVEITTARREDVVRVLAVTGRVNPLLENRVVPLVSGTVVQLTRREGDPVRKGEVLATIDAQVSQAAIDQARAQLAARRVDVDQRRREFERLRALNAAGGIADRDVDLARSALESAQVAVQQIEALIVEAQGRLRDYTLLSPITGYVLARPVDPGQNVTPQTVLYELASGTDFQIEAEIDEQYVSELRLGLPALVSPLSGDRTPKAARITYIGRRVSETSGAVPIRVAFNEKPASLPAGLSVDLTLEIARHPGAITVPRGAVAGLGDRPFVMAVSGGVTRRKSVDVIDWPSERIIVSAGVAAGDSIVATPRAVRADIVVRARLAPDAR